MDRCAALQTLINSHFVGKAHFSTGDTELPLCTSFPHHGRRRYCVLLRFSSVVLSVPFLLLHSPYCWDRGYSLCIGILAYHAEADARSPPQKAGHDTWLTSGTHSLLGGQGHGCKETAQCFPLRPSPATLFWVLPLDGSFQRDLKQR